MALDDLISQDGSLRIIRDVICDRLAVSRIADVAESREEAPCGEIDLI